jgi:hypothetical protein
METSMNRELLARPFEPRQIRQRPGQQGKTLTRQAMTFRDLRATGITWQAVRGDEPLRIMQRAGHTTFSTTMIYVRTAEELREGFGSVFPELPAELLAAPIARSKRTQAISDSATLREESSNWRKRTGIEPARDSGTAPHRF